MLSITIQSFSSSLDADVCIETNEEMTNVRRSGCKRRRWWTDDEKCFISNRWSNNISHHSNINVLTKLFIQ